MTAASMLTTATARLTRSIHGTPGPGRGDGAVAMSPGSRVWRVTGFGPRVSPRTAGVCRTRPRVAREKIRRSRKIRWSWQPKSQPHRRRRQADRLRVCSRHWKGYTRVRYGMIRPHATTTAYRYSRASRATTAAAKRTTPSPLRTLGLELRCPAMPHPQHSTLSPPNL